MITTIPTLKMVLKPEVVPLGAFGFRDLNGQLAIDFFELLLDVQQWFDDEVTGITKEVMDAAYDCFIEPNLPCCVNLESRTIPLGKSFRPGAQFYKEDRPWG